VRLLSISENPSLLGDLRAAVAGLDMVDSLVTHEGSLAHATALPVKGEFDLLLLDATGDGERELTGLSQVARQHPKLGVVLISNRESPELLLLALRLGVREVVRLPLARDTLAQTLERLQSRDAPAQAADGRTLAFVSCKGGAGTTFLAANIGYALAADQGKRVLLVDLNMQFGDAAMMLAERTPSTSVADVVRNVSMLDATLMRSSTLEILPNYHVLAAPADPSEANAIRPADIDALLRFARAHFDLVLLDLGRSLDAVSVQALDASDTVLLVLQQTLPFVRDGKRLAEEFRSLGYGKDKLRLVVNRYDTVSEVEVAQVEKAVSLEAIASVPNHYPSVVDSVNQGVAITHLNPKSPVARSIRQIAADLVADRSAPAARRWLSRVFGRA
jgi:pilus assembly protein CpaE